MGCAISRIEKEERVRICKERKRLMKQLVGFRGEFADAQLAYLRALKNTGVTLRQFTESESLELENTSYGLAMPSSTPITLPPLPPPPPPSFSPDLKRSNDSQKEEVSQEESMTIDENVCSTSSAPPITSSSLYMWNPFETYPQLQEESDMVEPIVEEENWADTRTEFEEEDREEGAVGSGAANSLPEKQLKQQPVELVDDNSSMMSRYTKDTADMAMVEWRRKRTLEVIVQELDDNFLKASAGGSGIAVLMDISKGGTSLLRNFKENKRKRSNSAKVFSALSWSWSSKSIQCGKDAAEACSLSEPCKPGAHCITLNKLYAAEQKLYKEVKEEEITKLECEKKSMLLLKQEEENHDWTRTVKTRLSVEHLETEIRCLRHSISGTCSLILKLIDLELYPQLVALTSGLKNMWRTMYECHQVQNHISQQLNHLTDNQNTEFTTDYRRQATAQLESEVNSWYLSFCKLTKSQREYVGTLCRWIQLTYCLVDDQQQSSCSSLVQELCKEWWIVLDGLPDKIASEAIKCLLSAIQSIMQQQAEEHYLHRKSDKLETRLQKELLSLAEMEKKFDSNSAAGDMQSDLSPKHPLSRKRAKAEVLKKRMDTEKTKYLNSVEVTGVKTLNSLRTGLPNVFRELMGFSSASVQAFEAVQNYYEAAVDCESLESSTI
uniref:DUF632 domain-containing protein n=1 Tax=Rhizophora mucronata TaxID=61149 RepID=A0A2P2P389_RHIMU